MGFKVKGTPKSDNFEVKNSVNAENRLKQYVLDQLSAFDIKTLQIAYIYAKNNIDYGVDVTEKWDTVCRNSKNLEMAYHKGYYEGYESARQTYFDKLKVNDVFDDGKVNLDSDLKAWTTISKLGEEGITVDDSGFKICTDEKKEPKFKVGDKLLISDAWSFDDDKVECIVTEVLDNDHYKVNSYGSELEVYEHEMELVKEENPQNPIYQFEIGQIVKKVNGYPDPLVFKVLDRFVVNLIRPYYKIGLIDKFFDQDSQEIVPNHYEYVPEDRLKLPDEDDTNNNGFKFHVGDFVKFRCADYGLFKITVRYADPNVNTYKIDNVHDGWSIVAYEHQLELVSRR